MRAWLRSLVVLIALAVAGASLPSVSVVGEAAAQSRERPNLLDVFRRKPRATRESTPRRATKRRATRRAKPRQVKRRAAPRRVKRAAPRRTKRATRRKQSAPKRVIRRAAPAAAAATTAAPDVEEVEKVENARIVLVVGDFVADGLADGLSETFADDPAVRVVNAANAASGLVRDDYHDWPERTAELIEKHEPSVVIVQLGANDRQPIKGNGAALDRGTEAWSKAYGERIAELAELAADDGRALVWVGAPPFRQRSLMSDMATFNGLYAAAAEQVGGTFIDIWDGFVDQNGAYVRTGPDVNGQVVRLRGSDGINFSRAGKRKLAFFAEKDVRRALGDAPLPGSLNAAIGDLPPLGGDLLEAPLQPRMSPPIALNDPSLDGGEALLGVGASTSSPAAPRANPALAPDTGVPAGRADDFAWPPNG